MQTRYIIVTYELQIKQKININVEANLAAEIVPSIIAGKTYMPISDVESSVTIAKDASFTSQIATSYIPDMYGEQKIVYSTSLPINTTVTLVDIRENEAQTYWYYKVTENNTSEINLSNFKKIGTTSRK